MVSLKSESVCKKNNRPKSVFINSDLFLQHLTKWDPITLVIFIML